MSQPYRKPNLNAPRFRPRKLNLTNEDAYKRFLKDNPKYSLSLQEFKRIITCFHGKIWQHAIDNRSGIELPEQMGYIFIGSCPRKKSNVDFGTSNKLGVKVQFQNWDSDAHVGKIFYTNYESKYRFRHHDLWGFEAVRDFKRTMGKVYPEQWKRYVVMDNMFRASRLFRSLKYKQTKAEEESSTMDQYDEFNLD